MAEQEERIDPELKEIIISRFSSSKLPDNIKLSIGNLTTEPLNVKELIQHIRDEDEIGRVMIEMELNYLRALKEGIIKKIQDGKMPNY